MIMKKEYIKPALFIIATEPSQIIATSQGSEEGGKTPEVDGDGFSSEVGGDGESEGETCSKGGLWDEYTW